MNIIDITTTETEQLIISTIDKLKQRAIEVRMANEPERKDFLDGYIFALVTIKLIISDETIGWL